MRERRYFNFLFTVLFFNINIDAQWFDISNKFPSGWGCLAIDACDSLTSIGPISFDPDLLFITTDGGNNWFSRPRPSIVYDIEMISRDKIWYSNWDGEIYATSDGGFNWRLQYYDPSSTGFMNYIEMFDSLNGIAMGDAPTPTDPALFLKTSDGGENWISQNDSSLIGLWSGDIWRRIDFVDENLGYFFSTLENPQKLYKTTNSGEDWIVLFDTTNCETIKFYDKNLGLIKARDCSSTPGMHRTTNGGESWEVMTTDIWEYGEDIEFIPDNPSKIWVLTIHSAYFSSDTGRTWSEQFSNSDITFWDIAFADSQHGWLTAFEGANSYLYYTSNGGFGGIVSVDKEKVLPNDDALLQNYPNPFNPSTKISFSIANPGFVIIKVYDILGNEVATLVHEEKPAGRYEITFDASGFSSGVYFYRLSSGNYISTKKLIVIK